MREFLGLAVRMGAILAELSLAGLGAAGDSLEVRNAVLISWDGAERAEVQRLLTRGELPNLRRLMEEGGMVPVQVTGHTTDTKAGHTQMLSGYPPQVTGVYSNGRYKAIPKGFSVFERFQQACGENVATLMVTGKRDNLGGRGPGHPLSRAREQKGRVSKTGEPFYLTKQALTLFDSNQAGCEVVGPKSLAALELARGKRFLAFFHFSDPDHAGHRHGEGSEEYRRAIRNCDEWLGKIREMLSAMGVAEKTGIFVTADHGFDILQKTHKNAPDVFLVSNLGLMGKSGRQLDIVPTVLEALGVGWEQFRPKLTGESLLSK
jgi:predicted AlkP superfamily pyrophosphatase or phosphodiesterase